MMNYLLIRALGACIFITPYPLLHWIGKRLGSLAYLFHTPFRKKAMANLAIAYPDLPEQERKRIAKKSFQNVAITCLEFFYWTPKRVEKRVRFQNNVAVSSLLDRGQGMVFMSGHQGNWEIPYLALTLRYPGVAVGQPIKNQRLYRWVLDVRQMNGGRIIHPKQTIKEGQKALAEGKFLGIVGDQAYPSSSYSYPLFGTRAWSATTPALLAYKNNVPLVVGITRRVGRNFFVSASKPLWPNRELPLKQAVPQLMDEAMSYLEKSIAKVPHEWMWFHDRWKQQGIDHIKRKYRTPFILVVLPQKPEPYLDALATLRTIYPRSFLTIFAPPGLSLCLPEVKVIRYEKEEELFVRDWRYGVLFDFVGSKKLRSHFLKLGAFHALHFPPHDVCAQIQAKVTKCR